MDVALVVPVRRLRFHSCVAIALACLSILAVVPPAYAYEIEDAGLQRLAAESYASKHRVSLDEAYRRLLIQDRAAGIEDRLEQLLDDQYAGVWYDHADQGRLKVGITRAASERTPEVMALISQFGLDDDTSLVSVTYTEAELERIQDNARESLLDLVRAGHASTGRKLSLNRVVVRALERLPADEEARIAALNHTEGLVVSRVAGDSLSITPTACAVSACDPPLRGGRSMVVCSAGFMARHRVYTDHLLVLTAGHCIYGGGLYEARDETLHQWIDIGFAYGGVLGGSLGVDAGVVFIEPTWFWGSPQPVAKVVVKASAQTAYNPNYKIKHDAKSTEGATLCWTGGYTGSACAEVSDLGQDHIMSGGVLLKNSGELDSCYTVGGDSGGPIYKANRGYGLLVGQINSTYHCFMVYQGVRGAENALNVDILEWQ